MIKTIKFFNNNNINFKEKMAILNAYKKGDISCFFSNIIKHSEQIFAQKIGMKHAVATSSCTAALYLAYSILNIKNDENIIIPNYTHPATLIAAQMARCSVKLCDSEPLSYDVNLNHLNQLIDKKTKAVVFVHLRGFKQNIKQVKKICDDKNIILIEDVAQGYGVVNEGKFCGSFGDISCFSFNDSKHIKLGEGGMLLTNDESLEKSARILVHEGECGAKTNVSTTICNGSNFDIINDVFSYRKGGFNFRPFPPAFSILKYRMNYQDKEKKRVKKLCDVYYEVFKETDIKMINFDADCNPLYFPLIVEDEKYVKNILYNSYNKGYPVGKMCYKTLNFYSEFDNIINIKDNFNNSEELFKRLIFLPLSKNISPKRAVSIAKHLIDVYKKDFKSNFLFEDEIKNFDGLFLW